MIVSPSAHRLWSHITIEPAPAGAEQDGPAARNLIGDRPPGESRRENCILRKAARGRRDQCNERQTQLSHDLAVDPEVRDGWREWSPRLTRRRRFARPFRHAPPPGRYPPTSAKRPWMRARRRYRLCRRAAGGRGKVSASKSWLSSRRTTTNINFRLRRLPIYSIRQLRLGFRPLRRPDRAPALVVAERRAGVDFGAPPPQHGPAGRLPWFSFSPC